MKNKYEDYLLWMREELDEDTYNTLTEVLTEPTFSVVLRQSNETGKNLWAIIACVNNKETDFWLNSSRSKEDMKNLCKEMGWSI